jgi:soluble P-type ATPase
MATIDIPGFGTLDLRHLVLDYNGTIALDGGLLPGVAERLAGLAQDLELHVVTADTFGTVAARLKDLPCRLSVLPPVGQDEAKLAYVRSLGASRVVAVGNGRNDRLMLREAALGLAVLGGEGASALALQAADVVCPDILAALDLLACPLRLVATLRS